MLERRCPSIPWYCSSDARLKHDITPLPNGALDKIMLLRPVDYVWNNDASSTVRAGFIAQDTLPHIPEAVGLDTEGYHTWDTTAVVSYGVKAIQELNVKLEDLATTTPETSWQPKSFISRFFTALKERLIAWFADAANGITDLYAKIGHFDEVHASKLCAGSTCVTETQLAALLSQFASPANPSPAASPTTAADTPQPATPPVIQINGANPAHIHVGDTYNDLGATITGPAADLNLGIKTFLNGALVSNLVLDTSATTTDIIDYVATDQNGVTSTSTRTVIIEFVAPFAPQSLPITNSPGLVPTDSPTSTVTSTSQ